jgi:hypothetical protein
MILQAVFLRAKISPSLRFSLTRRGAPRSDSTESASAIGDAWERTGRRKTARVAAENFILMSEFGIISKMLNVFDCEVIDIEVMMVMKWAEGLLLYSFWSLWKYVYSTEFILPRRS